ncbi:MAG: hypothetical protein JSV53_10400 [candidate division WOR-3 bacterium]|nr:MAG: hypothetical protein JSV53_10400 [candidate division WOR-3 bacterium]
MKLFERLEMLDRRIIFLLVGLAVIIPLIVPLGLPVDVSKPVQDVYNAVDALPERAIVVISCDYDPGSEAELTPATVAILEHCFRKNLRVYMMGLWPPGPELGNLALETVAPRYERVYGVDYINVGYRPGGPVMLVSLGRDVADLVRADHAGIPIDSFPLGRAVKSARDIDLVVTLSAGDPGVLHWIIYFSARYGTQIATATTAIMAPQQYPYLSSGQLVGLLGGLKGAAEYETLVELTGRATAGMDSQSIVHLLLVFFIVIGNIVLLYQKRRK